MRIYFTIMLAKRVIISLFCLFGLFYFVEQSNKLATIHNSFRNLRVHSHEAGGEFTRGVGTEFFDYSNRMESSFINIGSYSSSFSSNGRSLSGGGGEDSEHAAGHPSLFHALPAIHAEQGTYGVLIIILFILLLKQILGGLHALTHDTPFHGMVGNIEEELMVVGSSSFIFKVVLNTTNFGSNEWAYPLEFGEILVPLVAFSYCFLGVLLILISLKQCYTWSRAHNLKVLEILDDYFEASKTLFFK
jgi:hypothetical protein